MLVGDEAELLVHADFGSLTLVLGGSFGKELDIKSRLNPVSGVETGILGSWLTEADLSKGNDKSLNKHISSFSHLDSPTVFGRLRGCDRFPNSESPG